MALTTLTALAMVYVLVNVALWVKNVICAQVVILAMHAVNVQADIKKNKVENAQVSTIYINMCMYYFDSFTSLFLLKHVGVTKMDQMVLNAIH